MLTTLAALLLFSPAMRRDDPAKIVFVSDRNGNDEIYTMNSDGSDQKRLTVTKSKNIEPCWSPDGQKIAWASNQSGTWNIWTMDADGTDQTDLTGSTDRQETNPMWLEDPPTISFVSNKRIYTIHTDGDRMEQLFDTPMTDDCQPSVTPTGMTFLFRLADGQIMMKQGSESNTVVKIGYGENGVPKSAFHPVWSGDEADIAFDSGGEHPKIFLVDIKDLSCEPVVFEGDGSHPCFAKGDDSILFTSPTGEGKGSDVCIVDIDAVHKVHGLPKPTNLTHTPGNDFDACYWEPKTGG